MLADQAVSSATNFAVSILVARSVGIREFGQFSAAFIIYLIVIELVRSLSLEPLLIRYSGESHRSHPAVRSALGLALLVGVACSALLTVASFLFPGSTVVLLGLAVALPGLLLQDTCRYAFFAAGKPRSAFVNDLVWGTVLIFGAVSLPMLSKPTAGGYVLVWGLTGAFAGALGLWQLATAPSLGTVPGWLAEHRDITTRFVTETGLELGGLYGTFLLVGTLSGLADLAALNAGRVLMGPIGVLFIAASSFMVSEGARFSGDPSRVQRLVVALSGLLVTATLGWTAILVLLPPDVGPFLLGASWEEARPIIIAFGVFWAARGAIVGARSGLRVFAAARSSLRAQLASTVLLVFSSSIGVLVLGLRGAVFGLLAAGVTGLFIWWYQLLREVHLNRASSELGGMT